MANSGGSDVDDDLPQSFFCPILGKVFTDPVIALDGYTYERSAILEWIGRSGTSPFTREPLGVDDLCPNIALRDTISEWEAALARRATAVLNNGPSRVPWEDLDFSASSGDGPRQRIVGMGGFKQVQRASFAGRDVAVSSCRNGESVEVEAGVMHRLGCHPHIVRFYGLASDPQGVQHLVTSFARYGSLDNVLAELMEEDGVPNLKPLVQLAIAQQVCEAMQALSFAGVVHRDLAARNVLVLRQLSPSEPDSVSVQICDFGLSKPQYYMRSQQGAAGECLPVRYMAPEAIERNRWSEKSDVWAFGVLMWEVATMCAIPYQSSGIYETDQGVQAGVCGGRLRLPQPPGCGDELFRVMCKCWEQHAGNRPSFRELRLLLQEVVVSIHTSAAVAQSARPVEGRPVDQTIRGRLDSAGSLDEIRRASSLMHVQEAMKAHVNSVELQSNACEKICSLTTTAPNKAEAVRLGLLADVQAAMRDHIGVVGVQEGACKAIKNIAGNNDGGRVEAVRLGLLADVQAAMRAHRGVVGVQEAACGASMSIAHNNDGGKVEAVRLGLLADVQAAMSAHRGVVGVQKVACGAIISIARNNDAGKVEAVRLGLLADVQAAMSAHRGVEGVQKVARWAINNM